MMKKKDEEKMMNKGSERTKIKRQWKMKQKMEDDRYKVNLVSIDVSDGGWGGGGWRGGGFGSGNGCW